MSSCFNKASSPPTKDSGETCSWEAFDVTMAEGKTVGIVGYGDIGRTVAARVRPLGMKVLALKRHTAHVDPLVDQVFGPE
jgi:phosphoglycerate dehydrogenase-like enzyme